MSTPDLDAASAGACVLHTRLNVDEAFERKLRAAVSAGWRVLLVEVGLLSLVWVVYLAIMAAHPPVLIALWGPGVTWSTVATVSLFAIAGFKVVLWVQAGLLAWGALWASMLRRSNARIAETRSDSERNLSTPGSKTLRAQS